MLIKRNLGYAGARPGVDLFILQRQYKSVKDGSIAGLILQQRTLIKQTRYRQYHSFHPLLTTGFQKNLLAWETRHPYS